MKKRIVLMLLCVSLLSLNGCQDASSKKTNDLEQTLTDDKSDMFSAEDLEVGYDEDSCIPISLAKDSVACKASAVQITKSLITIKEAGTYLVSGTLSDGMIVVDVADDEKVRLVLDGVTIHSETSAAIYVKSADKVIITTTANSTNKLTNGKSYEAIDDNNIDAVIFSKADLVLNGEGSLSVQSPAGHGIVSKDDLMLTSGQYEISASSHGLAANDSVRIANGTYQIQAGKDGIQAQNDKDESLGFVYIANGDFKLDTDGDGISASANLHIVDGHFTINTGEGSESVTMVSDFGGFPFQQETTNEVSQKGIKASGELLLDGGTYTLDCSDDAFHTNDNLVINGGTFDIKSGDDAFHADIDVTISNGEFVIGYCYEGIEGLTVTIENGSFDITAFDDGINAADGSNQAPQPFAAATDCVITINGGTFKIESDGDCLDSNGDLNINGGHLDLTCHGNGNTALDCDGNFNHQGGDITTNDGSENNPGQMGGPGNMNGPGQMSEPGFDPKRRP